MERQDLSHAGQVCLQWPGLVLQVLESFWKINVTDIESTLKQVVNQVMACSPCIRVHPKYLAIEARYAFDQEFWQ